MKWQRAFGAILAVSLVATACSGDGGGEGDGDGSNEQVTLDFWAFKEGGIGAFLETLEAGFEDENPNIDLSITAYPEENYGVKVDTAIAAGQAPDLIVFPGSRPGPRRPDLAARRPGDRAGHRPLELRAGDRRRRDRGRARLRVRRPSVLPGYVRGLDTDALQQGHVRCGGHRVSRPLATDDAGGVRRHRLPAHGRGERGLGRRRHRSPGLHAAATCSSARTGEPPRATSTGRRWSTSSRSSRVATSRVASRPRTSWTRGSRAGTTSRAASSPWSSPTSRILKRWRTPGIN